jgi:uncharacterized protein YprB with RNaseH-like and TPR domain
MDLKDKLKYYMQVQQSVPVVGDNHQDVTRLAEQLRGVAQDGLVKIRHFIRYDTFIPDMISGFPEMISIPTLSKQHFANAFPVNNTVVLDLETTGLAGGTGTYPFLIGFGYPDNLGIEIVQYFLPDYGREAGAYLDMKPYHAEKSVLITYNGKTFDYPLLRNRLILNRIDNSLVSLAHLDLLHLSRRLWHTTLDSCTLQNVEQHIFHFMRFGDIDGMHIPAAYFNFLRSGETDDILRIIRHNQMDILTLMRLLLYLHHIETDMAQVNISDKELLNLFKLAAETGELTTTQMLYQQIRRRTIRLPENMVKLYSMVLKRNRSWTDALSLWSELLQEGRMVLFACEELAKYFEHILCDVKQAEQYTGRALDYLSFVGELYGVEESMSAFKHRQRRLAIKQGKTNR